jgi:hypothetical protein
LWTPDGREVQIPIAAFHPHPQWNHDASAGNDVGIVELEFTAPVEIERYGLVRLAAGTPAHAAELSDPLLMVGYGDRGTGVLGAEPDTAGTGRWGWNQYDATGAQFSSDYGITNGGSQLVFDLDNGLDANDALGTLGIHSDLGLGTFEVNIAHGDSGGPGFLDGLIAGVHSYGATHPVFPDVTEELDSSFGEVAVATRVSSYTDWIDQITGIRVLNEHDAKVALTPAGAWTPSSLGGMFGDSVYAGRSDARATYTFDSLSPGWYEVAVNTPGYPEYTTDRAVYTTTAGTERIVTTLDQRPGTHGWYTLNTIYVVGDRLQVVLSQGGRGNLRTDAVRIAPIAGYQVVDDDASPGTAYVESGVWYASGLPGFGGDSRYTYSGSATYTFDGLVDGDWYEVAVRAPGEPQYTTSMAVYTIGSGSSRVVSTLDQRPGIHDWLTLDRIQVAGGSLQVQLANGAQGSLRSDAVRIRRVPAPVSVTVDDQVPAGAGYAELAGSWISSTRGFAGDSRYSYSANAAARYTFSALEPGWYQVSANFLSSIYNSDRALVALNSGGNFTSVTIDQRAGSQGWKPLDVIRVDDGTLVVRLEQKGSGSLRADAVRIEPVAEPVNRTLDDSSPSVSGYQETGTWYASGLLGYGGDSRYSDSGTATWTFDAVSPGWYEIEVNFQASQYSTNRAAYTIRSGASQTVVNLDQRPGSDGWKRLQMFQATGETLSVQVAQGGQGGVRADAVRIRSLDNFFAAYARELDEYLRSRPAPSAATTGTASSTTGSIQTAAQIAMLNAGGPAHEARMVISGTGISTATVVPRIDFAASSARPTTLGSLAILVPGRIVPPAPRPTSSAAGKSETTIRLTSSRVPDLQHAVDEILGVWDDAVSFQRSW